MGFRLGHVPHVVAAESRALGEEFAQADGLIEETARAWKRAAGVWVEATIGQQEARPDRAGVLTGEQEVRQPPHALRVDDDVRAQEQDKSAVAALEALVGRTSVAAVLRLRQNGGLREPI